jgi:hypothetical protein
MTVDNGNFENIHHDINGNTLEEAEFFVQRYIEGNELGELGVLYQK